MTPGERFLRAVLEACDELGDNHTDPASWERFRRACDDARVVLNAERALQEAM